MEYIPLSNYLRTHRKRTGLTQREVAERIGVRNREVVARHESGARLPGLLIALRYAALYDTTVDELFRGLKRECWSVVERT